MKLARLTCGMILGAMPWMTSCSREPTPTADLVREEVVRPVDDRKVILFLGDSLTAGYQLDPEDAYPALIQRRLDKMGLPWRVVNAGVSGDTSLDGLNRLDWLLRQPVQILVLALGSNDALRGQPPEGIRANLDAILTRTHARYPGADLIVCGLKAPANYGEPYRSQFSALFPDLARTHAALLVPFLLEGVAANPDLNLIDGIHPNPAGHRVIADNVWNYLRDSIY